MKDMPHSPNFCTPWADAYGLFYKQREHSGNLRQLPGNQEYKPPVLDFTSNDVLSLSRDSEALHAVYCAGKQSGLGATGSRLLSGYSPVFDDLERKISQELCEEDALLFSSGFQANSSTLSALLNKDALGQEPLVFFDKANHASLYQGVFLAGAKMIRYRHNDCEHLESLLKRYVTARAPCFIVCESLHGMEGDCAPLEDILNLAKRYHSFLYVDEAHALGVLGFHGRGMACGLPWEGLPHLIMGGFGKAFGASGAFVACSRGLKEYLVNAAQGFIYSTAPSPALMGGVSFLWDKIRRMDKERKDILERSESLRYSLHSIGFSTLRSQHHIIPLVFENGSSQDRVRALWGALRTRLIATSFIRPPTVPAGHARLRLALTRQHSVQDQAFLVSALKDIVL